jgi:hypothetical protein
MVDWSKNFSLANERRNKPPPNAIRKRMRDKMDGLLGVSRGEK